MAMALSLPSQADESERALQRGVERQVLTLLHRARNPRALAAAPLMDVVCKAMGTSNPVTALERVVFTVFEGDDERAVSLRSAILEADFKRIASNAELARQNGVSRRHFQRRRAKAVTAIARFARTMLTSSHPETPSVPTNAWRFERERDAYVRARDRGAALEMRAIAKNLFRVAENRAARAFALECLADANVRLGRAAEAADQLTALPPLARHRVYSKLAVLHGDGAQTEFARAALSATSEQRYSFSLRERTAMEVEETRDLTYEWKWERAEALARCAYRKSASLGYGDLAARSAAALFTLAKARGKTASAQGWRAEAIAHLLPTQDRVLATGLFLEPAYDEPLHADHRLTGILYDRLCLVVPQMLGESDGRRACVRALLAAILDSQHDRAWSPGLAWAIAATARSDSAFAHYAERCLEPICEMLALTFVALTGSSWPACAERIRDAVAQSARELRPAQPRAIAIAVPQPRAKSHFGLADHLRFDDEPATGDRAPQAGADLRLRLLSI
jgi:hypothetical protein